MPSYVYVCRECGTQVVHEALLADGNICLEDSCGGELRRDWKAQATGFGVVPGGYRAGVRRGR